MAPTTEGINAAATKCCNRIPELERGEWVPHHPSYDCRDAALAEEAERTAHDLAMLASAQKYAHDYPEVVLDYSDADPGL